MWFFQICFLVLCCCFLFNLPFKHCRLPIVSQYVTYYT